MYFSNYILLFLVFITSADILNAQSRVKVDVRSEDLKKPNQRILYTKFENHLTIITEGISASDLTIAVSDGKVTDEDNIRTVIVDSTGKVAVYIISNADTLRKIYFIAETAPLPVPTLAGKIDGDITLKEILVAGSLKMINKSDLKELPKYKIVGFTLDIFTGMGMEYLQSNSDRFTTEQLSGFFNMKPGQKFLIQNVIAENEDQEKVNIGTAQFKLKRE